jgi:hypothetical protein
VLGMPLARLKDGWVQLLDGVLARAVATDPPL